MALDKPPLTVDVFYVQPLMRTRKKGLEESFFASLCENLLWTASYDGQKTMVDICSMNIHSAIFTLSVVQLNNFYKFSEDKVTNFKI